jgi:endonuclease/exonuclease/phosphatase family metal-dependent hydrolase
MSLNIRWNSPEDGIDRWEYRRETLLDAIAEVGADLLALQEVTDAQWPDVRSALGSHTLVRAADAGVVAGWSHRVKLVSTSTLAVPGDYPRAVIICELRFRGQRLTFVAAHFGGSPEQLERAAELVIRTLSFRPKPWILAGDFNALPYRFDEWPVLEAYPQFERSRSHFYDLILAAGFVDGFLELHGRSARSSGTRFGSYRGPVADFGIDARIDWIVATREVIFERAVLLDAFTARDRSISDHRATSAELVLREPTPGPQW